MARLRVPMLQAWREAKRASYKARTESNHNRLVQKIRRQYDKELEDALSGPTWNKKSRGLRLRGREGLAFEKNEAIIVPWGNSLSNLMQTKQPRW